MFVTSGSAVTSGGSALQMREDVGKKLKEVPGVAAALPVRFMQVNYRNPAGRECIVFVIGIDTGITLVRAENVRTGRVWKTFMGNAETRRGMQRGLYCSDRNKLTRRRYGNSITASPWAGMVTVSRPPFTTRCSAGAICAERLSVSPSPALGVRGRPIASYLARIETLGSTRRIIASRWRPRPSSSNVFAAPSWRVSGI